jgi:hypothetical protein
MGIMSCGTTGKIFDPPCVWGMDFELKLGRGGRLSEVEGPGVV